jgi:uncharacterized protein YcbX
MEVLGLWRHAVKSLQGERLESARFEYDGLVGDRRWGIRDLRTGRILTARRRPELLGAVASYDGELPMITLPDGCTAVGPGQGTDGLLSRWLGSPVSLVASAGNAGGRAEYFADCQSGKKPSSELVAPSRMAHTVSGRAVTRSCRDSGGQVFTRLRKKTRWKPACWARWVSVYPCWG